MAKATAEEETVPLTQDAGEPESSETARGSISSASTTSLVFDRIHDHVNSHKSGLTEQWNGYSDNEAAGARPWKQETFDIEDGKYTGFKSVDKKYRRILIAVVIVAFAGWLLALLVFLFGGTYKHDSTQPHAPIATATRGGGKKVTLDSVLHGQWAAHRHDLSWIKGRSGEDGMILERAEPGKKYLIVEDVRNRNDGNKAGEAITLMDLPSFDVNGAYVVPNRVWPSPDLKKVLVESDDQKNWRHSYTGIYWIFDVEKQTGEPLDPQHPKARVQLATWAPNSASVVFTRDNNLFIRDVNSQDVTQITEDGGAEFFNGVPDWVYEEEVFAGNSVTWWSDDSNYIAFLKTNESVVPTYPVQYFLSRPSGVEPEAGLENYPEVRQIKYPKAGAPNPVVTLEFYDVQKKEVFAIKIDDDFVDNDRLITEIVWAGDTGKVIVRETNRESDVLKVVLMDVKERNGKIVRTEDVNKIDGGWFEVSEDTTFIPSDPSNGRPNDGYIDTVIHDGYDHLAYFSPLDSGEPFLLTSGEWEVVDAPSAIDLNNNLVYFVATKESSIQRHIYKVGLDGKGFAPITDTSSEGWYNAKFSTGGGYVLLSYEGPKIPWQKIVSTSSYTGTYSEVIETNEGLAKDVARHDLPILVYSTINIDGFELNVLERRPPYFNAKHKYPVLFYMYQGPGSQSVEKKFNVDFQSYIASTLGYIVVTVDGRGTGFLGRKTRCIVRGNIGYWESHDQIAAAKMWAAKKYVDAERMAIWGWSYGGFMTLKTLEQDGGETFKYGMAVAPVTDWRFYDSIYTERYMHTPQNNEGGYENASISNVNRLSKNVRFLFMHGVADDNVHYQSTLTLMDKLDLAGIENYDMQVFPDSDHSIYFHNANRIVYDKLSNWLINAFNGEWLKTANPKPVLDWRRKLMYS